MKNLISCVLLLSVLAAASAQPVERQFPFPVALVETALRLLNAYTGTRLPGLEGFIHTDRAQLPHYERPYYEFKIEVTPAGPDRTLVRVKANISAWYADPEGKQPRYQAFESNGRLERDLLDRLNDLLTNNKSTIVTEPDILAKRLAEVRQQRLDAEQHIAGLDKQIQELQSAPKTAPPQFASVAQSRVPVFSGPEEHSSILLQAQSEDAFEVLEQRGAWLKVRLEDANVGWMRRSQIQADPPNAAPAKASGLEGFTVVRESVAEFSGDWPGLQGKKALYLWARPEGSSLNVSAANKLRFVQALFGERYREVSHSSQTSFAGLVIIFLDQKGGVAAANLADIGLWLDGSLTKPAFLAKCSFDPRSSFGMAVSPSRRPANP